MAEPEDHLSARPPATVVVPFTGSDEELRQLQSTLASLELRPGDELIVSDNRGDMVRTPGYARNRGAVAARGDWLVFIDADTIPDPRLLDAYFEPPPQPQTAILAGAIRDVGAGTTAVARSAVESRRMSHRTTLDRPGTPYAQTANCAIRRSAFEAAGGFEEHARAGEDADLCFRLLRAGWRLEERPEAAVAHRSRETLRAWMRQMLTHGSGAAWIERRWPGELPAMRPLSLARRLGRDVTDAVTALAAGDRTRAENALLDLLGAAAFELGRLRPNTRRPRDDRMMIR